jgi:hypothetical protein
VDSRVEIYGYTESYLMSPSVTVFLNEVEVGAVKKGGVLTFEISEDGEVSFRCNGRKGSVPVKAGQVNKIRLTFNRISGKLSGKFMD